MTAGSSIANAIKNAANDLIKGANRCKEWAKTESERMQRIVYTVEKLNEENMRLYAEIQRRESDLNQSVNAELAIQTAADVLSIDRLAVIDKSLDVISDEVRVTNVRLEDASSKYNDALTRTRAKCVKIDQMRSALESNITERVELTGELTILDTGIEDMRSQIVTDQGNVDRLIVEREESEKRDTALRGDIATVELHCEQLRADSAELVVAIDQLESESCSRQSRLVTELNLLRKCQESLPEVRRIRNSLQRQDTQSVMITETEKQIAQCRDRLTSMQLDDSSLNEELYNVAAVARDQAVTRDYLEGDRKVLVSEIKKAKGRLEVSRSKVDAVTLELNELLAAVATQMKEVALLNTRTDELALLRSNVSSLAVERNQMTGHTEAEVASAASRVAEQLSAAEAELQKTRESTKTINTTIRTRKAGLDRAMKKAPPISDIGESERTLSSVRSEHEAIKWRLQEVRRQKDEAQRYKSELLIRVEEADRKRSDHERVTIATLTAKLDQRLQDKVEEGQRRVKTFRKTQSVG